MDASHTIEVDPRTSLVTLTLSGFFDEASLTLFAQDLAVAYKQLRCAPNEHMTLCDVTDCKLQAQDMVAAFQRIIADPRSRSRKLAFVVGGSLARMQVRRVMAGRDDVATFATRQEALGWLRETGRQPERQPLAIPAAGRRV